MIRLIADRGVERDAHIGSLVQHRYDILKKPGSRNLRQVHLIHEELFEELRVRAFTIKAGDLGENITTKGLDILALPRGTRLRLGEKAIIEITGLRAPCKQMDRFSPGLAKAVISRDCAGRRTSKAGVMAVVIKSGNVRAGDAILVQLPAGKHELLRPV